MSEKYNILKQIIDFWEIYEREEDQLTTLDFAKWMVFRIQEEPELNRKIIRNKLSNELSQNAGYLDNLDEKAQFLEYISRIARLQDYYTRKFFSELPVNTRLEFLFLQTVHLMDKAKKTDLINVHLVEYTTGMDTIRRLVNNGLLKEMQDNSDKRAKLLVLTKEGEKVLERAKRKIDDERNMFLACISANKWKKALPVLKEMNDFHYHIYLNHNDKPHAELLNLMDSLKHLYK